MGKELGFYFCASNQLGRNFESLVRWVDRQSRVDRLSARAGRVVRLRTLHEESCDVH